jgi:hypothetical protein
MSAWSYNFEKELEVQIEGLQRMQTNYLNFRLLNNSAKKIDELSEHCEQCTAYKKDYDALLAKIDTLSKDDDLLRHYETKMLEVVDHLKKHHQIKSRTFYSSFYAFLGLFLGLALSIIFNLIIYNEVLTILSLYGAFTGLIVGRFTGLITDKRMLKIGKTI